MRFTKTLLAAAISIGTIGATTATASAYYVNPAPTVVVVRTPQACDAYARSYANNHAGNRGVRIGAGGLIGAGIGALAGGFFFGTPVAGAVVGGTVGLGAGAVIGQPQWQAEYNNAYGACIYGQPLYY